MTPGTADEARGVVKGAGSFFDGESAARRKVEITLAPNDIRIREAEPGGRELACWGYREVRPVDVWTGGGPLRIRAGNGPAKLVVESPALTAALAARAPRLTAREPGWRRLGLRWAGLLMLSFAVLLATLWFGLPRFAEEVTRIVPRQWESALGENLVEPVLRALAQFDNTDEVAFCTAPRGVEALAALTGRIAPTESPYRFAVRVVNLEMVNAFALPGGQIVIAEGLLDFAASPEEIAGVLAHEMAHVLHRHSTVAIIEALGLALLFGALLGDVGVGVVGATGETLIGLSYRRGAEEEADERALELLVRAGIGGQGLADLFERLQRKSSELPTYLRFLSTHPPHEHRRRRAAERSSPGAPSLDRNQWRSFKAICDQSEPLAPSDPVPAPIHRSR